MRAIHLCDILSTNPDRSNLNAPHELPEKNSVEDAFISLHAVFIINEHLPG